MFTAPQMPTLQNARMCAKNVQNLELWSIPPNEAAMRAANVNPTTGLATDFLNLFNEYIMLAELVLDGSMLPDVLSDWMPTDYETHFSLSGFAGSEVVLASYRALTAGVRAEFEDAVNMLIELILDHQMTEHPSDDQINLIKHRRDHLSTLISDPVHLTDIDNKDTQAAIDALFD